MKLIIAGGRDFNLTATDFETLDRIEGVTVVVSGCARGADRGGMRWARSRGIPIVEFPADWDTHGKAAGPIRNQAMADFADALAVFPGGAGTVDMIRRAQAKGLKVYDFRQHNGPVPATD